jgi:triosephosphate isomerase
MLKDMGASHVIVGHSERRAGHHESNDLIRAKADAALAVGLTAIVCVGESEPERRAGRACEVVAPAFAGSIPGGASPATMVLAYEPIWAIGSGRVPSLADEVVDDPFASAPAVQNCMGGDASGVRILYGGSVNHLMPGIPGFARRRWMSGRRRQPQGGRILGDRTCVSGRAA